MITCNVSKQANHRNCDDDIPFSILALRFLVKCMDPENVHAKLSTYPILRNPFQQYGRHATNTHIIQHYKKTIAKMIREMITLCKRTLCCSNMGCGRKYR